MELKLSFVSVANGLPHNGQRVIAVTKDEIYPDCIYQGDGGGFLPYEHRMDPIKGVLYWTDIFKQKHHVLQRAWYRLCEQLPNPDEQVEIVCDDGRYLNANAYAKCGDEKKLFFVILGTQEQVEMEKVVVWRIR